MAVAGSCVQLQKAGRQDLGQNHETSPLELGFGVWLEVANVYVHLSMHKGGQGQNKTPN